MSVLLLIIMGHVYLQVIIGTLNEMRPGSLYFID